MTNKKRFMICLSEKDLIIVNNLKLMLNTKQLSKVISYCLSYTYLNDSVETKDN